MTNYITKVCPVCGKTYFAHPQRLKHGRQTSCSRACSYKLRFREDPNLREMRVCVGCGKTFEILKSKLRQRQVGIGKYCSRACRDKYRIGEQHPQHINGLHSHRYGPYWYATRRKVLRRDNHTCQHCGKIGVQLHVHHIRPFRLFPSWMQANALENLITLCAACHRKAEAEIQRDDALKGSSVGGTVFSKYVQLPLFTSDEEKSA